MKQIRFTKLFALAILIACAGSLKAQTLSLGGRVTEKGSDEALPFVNVALMRPTDTVFMRGATTDIDGNFVIKDIDPGQYILQASFVGYESYHSLIDVNADRRDMAISLRRGTTLKTVDIVAEKPLFIMDGEKNMYNTKDDPSIQTGTASDALQNAPGVEVDAEGNITLRGVSSVEIWINDRPSHMNEEALKQYIKQMPANAIERIEVITNPSARYSTSGGVINIVTNQKITRNELLCVGLRATTTPAISPWVSYVWANEKVDFNFYLTGNYGNHNGEEDGTSLLLVNGDTNRYQKFDTKTKMPYWGGYMGFNMNWNIDSTSSLTAWLGAWPYSDRNSFYNDYQYYEYKPTLRNLSYLDTVKNHGTTYGGYAGAWYEKRFDSTGRKLSASFNGFFYRNYGYSDNWRDYANSTDFRRHSDADTYAPNASVEVNYTHPLKNNYEIEAGAEVGVGGNYNNETLDSLLSTGDWNNMAYRSYEAKGKYLSTAAYVTAQKRWGGITAKLGLRFEDKFLSGEVEHYGLNDKVTKDTAFPGLVPSIHFSYQTQNFESYSLSYTRRFAASDNLLDYTDFRVYDEYSYRTGNPNLLMSYTHNLEAAYNKYIMGFGNIGLNAYFRANTNEIGATSLTDSTDLYYAYDVNYTKSVNIGSSHTEGFEANITYRPSGFFNVRLNASVFNYGYNYEGTKDNKWSWSARLNLWAKVGGWLELFANAHYTSPRLGLYSLTNANKGIDFGASADFFERQLSVNLTVNDIFGMAEYGSNTTAPNYQTTGGRRFDSRFVSVGLTWRIGKMELESKARQGATDNAPQM